MAAPRQIRHAVMRQRPSGLSSVKRPAGSFLWDASVCGLCAIMNQIIKMLPSGILQAAEECSIPVIPGYVTFGMVYGI